MTNPPFIKKLNLLLYYVSRAIKLTKGECGIYVCRYLGRIDLQDINSFRGGSTNDLIKELGKSFLDALYGVLAKNILQSMQIISLSRKAVTTKQDNYMEITDAL